MKQAILIKLKNNIAQMLNQDSADLALELSYQKI